MDKYYRVYANSCDFGVVVTNNDQDARDIAAEMAGYASENDMEACLDSTSEIVALELDGISSKDIPLIQNWINCAECDVDSDGDVWVSGPMTGHWLSDEKKLEYIVWRENQ